MIITIHVVGAKKNDFLNIRHKLFLLKILLTQKKTMRNRERMRRGEKQENEGKRHREREKEREI